MQTLGDYLKKNREAQNISLSDVSDYTKISITYLAFLENNECHKLPPKPYIEGYISSYAAYVGLDPHEALKLYDSFQNEADDAKESTCGIPQDIKSTMPRFHWISKKTGLVSAVGILIVLSIGLYYFFIHKQEETVADKSPAHQHKTAQSARVSTIAHDSPKHKQNKKSLQSSKQDGFKKTIETRQIGTKHHDGMPQMSDKQPISRPNQNSIKALPHQPVEEFSRTNALSGSDNGPRHSENGVKIIEAAACSSVKDRTPQGPGESFEWSMDRIFIWTRIKCESPPASIRHIYYFKGEKVNDILLKIRSYNWRTWSYKTLSDKSYIGPWRVDITSSDGKLLQSINFEVS